MQYFLKLFTISALGFFIITGTKAQMSANPPEISDKIPQWERSLIETSS